MSDPHIEVSLTDAKVLHCFKLVFQVKTDTHPERAPLQIYLHATQAFDLFHKLGGVLLEYFSQTSAELLRKVFENHEARDLLREALNMMQTSIVVTGSWSPDELKAMAQKIDGFLAITSAINHPRINDPRMNDPRIKSSEAGK